MKEKKERTQMIKNAIENSFGKPVYYGYWADLARSLNITPQMLNKIKQRILKRKVVESK